MQAVVEELRLLDRRLDRVDPHRIQVEEWQRFFEYLEDFDPEIAALMDTRSPRARGEDADEP